MTGDATGNLERLNLQSSLSDLTLISPWIEHLSAQFAIPGDLHFAIDLCLQEVISNVMRHGYRGQPGRPILVRFFSPREGHFVFAVEDEAPPFDPIAAPELPCVDSTGQPRIGGHGIRLVRHFADSLEYHRKPTGNCLVMVFRPEVHASAR